MKPIRQILDSSRGFTLIELLISVTILTVVTGIFGAAMFQVLSIQRFWTDDVKAVREVRHAGSWFSGDALNATDVLDAGGADRLTCTPSPAVQQITLTWTDQVGTDHNVVYKVAGEELQREFFTSGASNGAPLVMATRVVANSVSFTLCGSTLRLNMDVQADRGTNDNLDLITYMRKLS